MLVFNPLKAAVAKQVTFPTVVMKTVMVVNWRERVEEGAERV